MGRALARLFSGFAAAALVMAGLVASTAASAGVIYSFDQITLNGGDPAVEGQLSVEVSDAGGGFVNFTFRNAGPLASSITDVYFDDGTLLGIANIFNGPGVLFSQGASPGNLPGGNLATPPFVATAGFTADSDAPTQPNGVNPNEWLIVQFDLQSGQTYADTLAALASGALRIGIHVQGYANGQSESFINNGPGFIPVPEPGTLALLGLGLLGLAAVSKRRR